MIKNSFIRRQERRKGALERFKIAYPDNEKYVARKQRELESLKKHLNV